MYTSIQDKGRFGYRNLGIPLSGVMDSRSADLANALVGNNLEAAVLECTVTGPVLYFETDAKIAIVGGGCAPKIQNVAVPLHKIVHVAAGSTLVMGRITNGLRTYIAVRGGIASACVLGSRSQYRGITSEEKIKKGVHLAVASEVSEHRRVGVSFSSTNFTSSVIKVDPGPEFGAVAPFFQKNPSEVSFTIASESNRMAILLDSTIRFSAEEIITAPVQPGTVQLTPSGQIIVLMRDAQTTGGYARILQLTATAIDVLAQKRPGEKIQFEVMNLF